MTLCTDPTQCAERWATLTDRQREVLLCVIREESQKVAADRLGLSRYTIEATLTAVRRKLGARTVTAAAVMAAKAGAL